MTLSIADFGGKVLRNMSPNDTYLTFAYPYNISYKIFLERRRKIWDKMAMCKITLLIDPLNHL